MENKAKDFFISYTKNDVQWAKWIAGTLEKGENGKGYTTIIQAWDFKAGTNIINNMNESFRDSKRWVYDKIPNKGTKSTNTYIAVI